MVGASANSGKLVSDKTHSLVRNTAIISVGGAGASVIKMLNVLLFTHFVSAQQVGDYDVVLVYVGLVSPIVMLAMHEAVYRWLLDNDADDASSVSTSFAIMVAAVAFADCLLVVILVNIAYKYVLELGLLIITTSLYTFSQFLTRGLRNNEVYAVQGVIYAIVLVLSNVALIIICGMQASGLLLSVAIADVVAVIFAFAWQRIPSRYLSRGSLSKRVGRSQLAYSLPIIPNGVSWWLVSASSRVIINGALGAAANGVFAISNRFPSVLSLATTFFYQAWQEYAITEYESADRDSHYSKVLNAYIRVLFGAVALLLPISALVIYLLVDESFFQSIKYLGPLYLGAAFNALSAFYGTGFLSTKKTAGALISTLCGAGVTIGFVMAFIHVMGLHAAALGGMFGNLAIWLVRIAQTKTFFSVEIEFPSFVVGLLVCIAESLLIALSGVMGAWLLLGVGAVFAGVYNRSLSRIAIQRIVGRRWR